MQGNWSLGVQDQPDFKGTIPVLDASTRPDFCVWYWFHPLTVDAAYAA